MKTKEFHIISAFPKILDSYYNESILKRAQKDKYIKIVNHNLRDFTNDKRKTIDDTPYGGGVGMVLMIEPIYKAWKSIKQSSSFGLRMPGKKTKSLTILLTPVGKAFKQQVARDLSDYDQLIFICGHYEGVDARVNNFVDLKLSIGDYVLTGGELGAAVIIDAVTRLVHGVLGNDQSTEDESHSKEGVLEYPQYTKPETFKARLTKKWSVPDILLSGHHAKINDWRENNREK
ncbi:MAG: tRNA (guanosine(37)-N1)-methyltransferase TrmD [Parcubacteria group bacterium CG1_02_37_51]|uniref:tRNA (guanine-N(1)-)-methyltransferase n=2 Tax=Candidatus Komeiliibacteriota TaxID=1817908 RepID=A0A2M8DQI5_9BACT|nr:MAG: tRNA (guanosine(37)-N1)-methyltransferase TrmD [Parcubacteria group bacterium CG1_02_37_51]PIY94979.1 MAG: tRNA (guanosine(37)-N1)-methyltransferase TrmD [Candidatus Komeilibacteria bacterium CG_4_10_14_0_8_um_filter_37_78]PJC01284.1 MAG: tRNA (guanosine(37)-N1)-methyltransferase TrmD [Candidatus Komeilibacteria bacterium CG_4_9_14_0_8_um_filter_36_9]